MPFHCHSYNFLIHDIPIFTIKRTIKLILVNVETVVANLAAIAVGYV